MIGQRTYLPHTYENQAVLREYGKKISSAMEKNQSAPAPSLWSRISYYLPSMQIVGYTAGEHLAMTYGAQWSNSTIDFVVRQFFKPEPAPTSSFWIWQSVKNFFSGATQTTVAETLKLTFTPKAVPYIMVFTGAVTAVTLPMVVSLVSLAYQRVMFDPRKLKQLSHLTLDKLFTIDAETGRLRDAFGRLLSREDMEDILTGAAKYDLICKLIDLCHRVDQLPGDDDELQAETQKSLQELVQSYIILRQDGKLMFPDGHLCTAEENESIQQGIATLSRINPLRKSKQIRGLIKILAKHSLVPLETLSAEDKNFVRGAHPKRMPSLFSKESDAWKQAIISTSDGKFVIAQDAGGKKRGEIIPAKEMKGIFKELEVIQAQKTSEQHAKLGKLLAQPKKHPLLVEELNRLSREDLKAFFRHYIIERKQDKQAVFCNGDLLEAKGWQQFQQDLALLPTTQNLATRADKINKLVKLVASHLPKRGKQDDSVIHCQDGIKINNKGETISKSSGQKKTDPVKLVEAISH